MTLTLFRGPNAWCVRYDDPSITALFGTDTLPTAFTLDAPPGEVLAALAHRHPQHRIVIDAGITIEAEHVTLQPPSSTLSTRSPSSLDTLHSTLPMPRPP